MSDATALPVRGLPHGIFTAEPRFAATGLFLGLSLALTVPAMLLDPRLFQGEAIWIKPVKFQVALCVYMLTLAFYARWLPEGVTRRPAYRVFSVVVVAAVLLETLWIGGAAMFGTASHFNTEIPAMAVLYMVMGALAVTLTSASLVYGLAIGRNAAAGLSPALRLSIALGLILTFALTVPVAGTLSAMNGHLVGDPVTGAALPLMGWSREVGDLRVAHFFATHAMHFLPLAGLGCAALLSPLAARRAVQVTAGLLVAVTLATFVQALAGLPLLPVF
ncbi:hypothetical protein [Roseovarius sp.]|uniref:hypothetical protein n=1 Tax=Roseovarius sp. TaxID=1486281 RepID=UPI00263494C5|nr:hypothetical protein [Roseovarius sp.]MDM8166143.1 hypothetical protein [Roseovarius sp.]